jgi:putative sterol carrier protein
VVAGKLTLGEGPAEKPDHVIEAPADVFSRWGVGHVDTADAIAEMKLRLEVFGEPEAATIEQLAEKWIRTQQVGVRSSPFQLWARPRARCRLAHSRPRFETGP